VEPFELDPDRRWTMNGHAHDRDVATERPFRFGVVGGGAVAEVHHLPTLAAFPGVETTALAELNPERRSRLCQQFGIPIGVANYRELAGSIDAAIVAVPHKFHAPVAVDLLRSGVHVLVEKPMALSTVECDAMIAAAESSGATLAVGLMRRFSPVLAFARDVICSGVLGDVRRFEYGEGNVFSWNIASSVAFDPSSGGVLADIGAHAVDLLVWWFGDCTDVTCFDDSRGGVECDALVEMTMRSGVSGVMELSRARALPNACRIEGSRGVLDVGIRGANQRVRLQLSGADRALQGTVSADSIVWKSLRDAFRLQLIDFLAAIREGRPPAVSGAEARRSVDVIERCYRSRRRLEREWESVMGVR